MVFCCPPLALKAGTERLCFSNKSYQEGLSETTRTGNKVLLEENRRRDQ